MTVTTESRITIETTPIKSVRERLADPLAAIAAEVQAPHFRQTGTFRNVSLRNQLLARVSKNWIIEAAQKGIIDPQAAKSAEIIELVKASARRGLVQALRDLRQETAVRKVA